MNPAKRRRVIPKSLITPPKNCCLSCGTHFKRGKTRVVWHDVVECIFCGHIWILLDMTEYERWT